MLKGALQQNTFVMTPQLVLMNFETVARNALNAVFSTNEIKSMLFSLYTVYMV